jgi:pimeloyl-ACP methyl ester carboxylesterase
MPSAKRFVLKDSPPEILEVAKVKPKGRTYDPAYSQKPGGVHIEELVLAMKLASIAITDDKPDTLKNISKANPWHTEALTIITGSTEEANKPLTEILKTHFNLECDIIIDVHKVTKGGHVVDTQGYIAHNDEMIVLSYRCTTTGFDWLTNLTTTSSAWEPEVDIDQGHSGLFSCVDCCMHGDGEYKPRVHTGFYNNFLVTAPLIQQYIDPLLGPDQPKRKLYVVGHSLGAGIATMAACYFLLNNDWATLNQKLVVVTAGSPRAVLESMQQKIHAEWKRLRPLDKLVICRIVRDKDVVPSVPPALFGFRHLDKLVYITKDGQIIVNPNLDGSNFVDVKTLGSLAIRHPSLLDDDPDDVVEDNTEEETEYDQQIKMIPRPFRDHMPDFYLYPLIKLFKLEAAGDTVMIEKTESDGTASTKSATSLTDGEATEKLSNVQKKSDKSTMKKKFGSVFRRKKKNKKVVESQTNHEGVTA